MADSQPKLAWFCLIFFKRTSRISLILQPPFPIREPHWLAGTTMRRVTGGLLVAVLFVIELLMSWMQIQRRVVILFASRLTAKLISELIPPKSCATSSSFSMIMENALKMAVVGPAKVMILSGQLPSEMLMRAPLCGQREERQVENGTCESQILFLFYKEQRAHLFSHLLHRFTFLLAKNHNKKISQECWTPSQTLCRFNESAAYLSDDTSHFLKQENMYKHIRL